MPNPTCTYCGQENQPCCESDKPCTGSVCEDHMCRNPGAVGYGDVCVPGNKPACNLDALVCNTDVYPPICLCGKGTENQTCGVGLVCADSGPMAPTAGSAHAAAPYGQEPIVASPTPQFPECSVLMQDDYKPNLNKCVIVGKTPVAGMCYDSEEGIGDPSKGCFTSLEALMEAGPCTFGDADRINSEAHRSGKCVVNRA